MKGITNNTPDDSSEHIIELVERFGGSVDKKKEGTKKRQRLITHLKKKLGNPTKN